MVSELGFKVLSFTREKFQEAFESLCEDSIKMAKRNEMFKESINKVTLEKESLEQNMVPIKNEVASLQEKWKNQYKFEG